MKAKDVAWLVVQRHPVQTEQAMGYQPEAGMYTGTWAGIGGVSGAERAGQGASCSQVCNRCNLGK